MWRLVLFLQVLFTLAGTGSAAAQLDWTTYHNERFGFSLDYPQGVFGTVTPLPGKDAGHAFFSIDGAEIVAQGMPSGGLTLDAFLKQFRDTGAVTNEERGADWFAVTRNQRGVIWYNKAIFSCGGKILNHLSIGIPVDKQENYQAVVERMGESFQAGKGTDTPADCDS